MSEMSYRVSKEEKAIISENVGGIISDMRDNVFTPQEFQDIARLLQVNQGNFDKYKAETWFKKSWLTISGKRGKLTDISINNLGKVQLGVLKLLGEILEDSSGIKNDLLLVFGRIDHIQQQSVELKAVILKFNQKYEKRFQRLQREIEETRWSLRLSQVVLGLGCIAGAALVFVPGLREQYWQYGVVGGGVTGAFLIGQFAIGSIKSKKKPIPVGPGQKISIHQEKRQDILQACQFLGLEETPEEPSEDARIFKIESHINDLMDYFKLSSEEQRLLFSLQHYLCRNDGERTVDTAIKKRKTDWLDAWQKTIEMQLRGSLVNDSDILFGSSAEFVGRLQAMGA